MSRVYLDHAATTPVCDAAFEAMTPFLRAAFGNASEPHAEGRDAAGALELARERVASLLGAEPAQVVLTSGGTEADNLALLGLAGDPPGRVVVSAVEHPAVREPALALAARGFEVATVPVDGAGLVDPDAFAACLRPGDRVAAVMWANNVTGVVQPVAALTALAAERGVPLHSDAVQAAASLPLHFGASGAETIALSAHKLYGPKGAGCLVARDPDRLRPLLRGGGQERGLRPGTENVAGAAGLAAALGWLRTAADRRGELRDRLERALEGLATPLCRSSPRLPGHSLLLVPGVRAETLVLALDDAGFAVSAGSACASGEAAPSHVLVAQGLSADEARSVVRVTLGIATTPEQVDAFAAALADAVPRLRRAALV